MNLIKPLQQKAFTLIEVMAAVAVFTISSVGLYTVNQQNVLLAERLQNKTFAHWVALNTFNRLDIEVNPPGPGTDTSKEKLAGIEWRVTTETEETTLASVKRVTIKVQDESDQEFAKLIGYIGERLPRLNGTSQ